MNKAKLLLIALFAGSMHARVNANTFDEKYFTVDPASIKIEALDEKGGTVGPTIPVNPGTPPAVNPVPSPADLPTPPAPSGPTIPGIPGTGNGDDIFVILEKIINLGEKIFAIIEKNKPVVDIKVNYANAVPYGITHWTQLAGWLKPKTQAYEFSMKNLYGSQVVKVKYQVHWTHNGQFKGKGKFLTGVTIEPISVTAAWGYTVNLVAEVPDSTIANVGTDEDPVASMQVQLKWKVATMLKEIDEKVIYYVQGDGYIEQIATPFEGKVDAEKKIEKAAELINNSKF
ncbi:MAG: hypothetical protein HY746_09065 [Elusimicrobia bacterium]|nr:hypothetical protein [Elusimicrobiota bacterium]